MLLLTQISMQAHFFGMIRIGVPATNQHHDPSAEFEYPIHRNHLLGGLDWPSDGYYDSFELGDFHV